MIIYKITNKINGKIYVGQTTRSLNERILEHARHNTIVVDKAMQKYGIDSFEIEQIDSASNIDELNEREKYWIKYYDCVVPNGYNQCNGGENTAGYHHKEESKRKMSKTKSAIYIGRNNPFFGKKHSDISKKKMSEQRKGMGHLSEEQVKRLRSSHYKVKVRNVETGEVFDSAKEAATKYGLKETHIIRVCKGKRNRTGGFHWCYEESQ